MKVNSISPNFTGFVTAQTLSDNKKHFINTSRIVDISSEYRPGIDKDVNVIKYLNGNNELVTVKGVHSRSKDEDSIYDIPVGNNFVEVVGKVCNHADKSGSVLSILV